MKVRNSLKSLRARHRDNRLVRRKGKDATQDEFVGTVLARYPWVTAANAARLFNQSMYYAWKTGGPPRDGQGGPA